jgi:NADH-quinone oxidoreductase subunit J
MDNSVQWLTAHWQLALPMVLGAVAVWGLMPKGEHRSKLVPWLIGVTAFAWMGATLLRPTGDVVQDLLFALFAGVAIVAGTLMITNRNPVYSALWFAVVTLCVCGLFLLQSAPFLASATVIVYAGAIIVTFLFVIMLAQQAGATAYDQRSRQPGVAAFTGFVLLGALLFVLAPPKGAASNSGPRGFASLKLPSRAASSTPAASTPAATANEATRSATAEDSRRADLWQSVPQSTSTATTETFGTMRGLGRSLFGDYLFAVELAGTLLLVASIGAIVIAPKRSSGKL